MSEELALTPDRNAQLTSLKRRVAYLERQRPYQPVALPAVTIGEAQGPGFSAVDDTSFNDVFRADVFCTAPILDYDFNVTTAYGTGITSVEYQLKLIQYDVGLTETILATGSTASTVQAAAQIDLFDLIGEELFQQFVRLNVEVKRTGGSGVAAARLNKPLLLRVGQ